jgi:hypothetical protein
MNSHIQVDGGWRGTAPGQDVRVDPETLERVGYQLMGHAGGLGRDPAAYSYPIMYGYVEAESVEGTTADLKYLVDEVRARPGWFGSWETARLMENSLVEAGQAILNFYQQLETQLGEAGRLFTTTARDYQGTDQDSAAALDATWDHVASRPVDEPGPGGQRAGEIERSREVPYISVYEDVDSQDPKQILNEIKQVQGSWTNLSRAGEAFAAAARQLRNTYGELKGASATLDGAWSSESSAASQQALQKIAATAEHLAEVSEKVSEYSYESGETLSRAVGTFPLDTDLDALKDVSVAEQTTDFLGFTDNANEYDAKVAEIRQAKATLNENYRSVNYTMLPSNVNVRLPELKAMPIRDEGSDPGGSGGSGGGPGSSVASPGSPGASGAGSGGSSGAAPAGASTVSSVAGPGELAGAGSGFAGGGIPGGVGSDLDLSSGGLAGAGGLGPVGGAPAPGGGVGVGGIGPAGGGIPGGITPGGVGGPGAGVVGPGGVGLTPGVVPGTGGAGGRSTTGGSGPLGRGSAGGVSGAGARPGVPGARPGITGGMVPAGGAGAGGASGGRSGGTGVGGRPGAGGGVGGAGARPGVAGARPGGAGGMVPAGGAGAGASGSGSRAGGPGAGGRPGMTGGTAGGRGAGGMPMAGVGRGKDKEHSSHDSWLVEDDDPWRGDEDVPPGVIK